MKVYELKMQEGGKGVFRVSVVKDPAIESTLLYFNAEQEKNEVLTFSDEEKRVIYSVAMRPNKNIFRKDINGEPAQVYYTADTVEKLQINYFRNHGNLQTNINHSDDSVAQGIFPFESWTVKDPAKDKSTLMGMNTMEGDWVMAYKVDNEEIWKDYIKTGKLDGLSIEATNMNYEFKTEIEMSKEPKEEKSLIDKMMDFLFTMKSETEEKPVEEEKPVVVAKEEEPIEEPVKAAEDLEPEAKVEVKVEPTEEVEEEPTEKEKMLMEEIVALKQTIATLEADKVKAETDLETMAKQTPATIKIKNVPTPEVAVPYEKMTKFQQLKFNRENR